MQSVVLSEASPWFGSPSEGDASLLDADGGHAAYLRALPAARALPKRSLRPINLELLHAVGTARNAAARTGRFRERIRALPEFNLHYFDWLDTYALAALYANTRFRLSISAPGEIAALNEAGSRLRRALLRDVASLVERGLLPPGAPGRVNARTGYQKLAYDLGGLAVLLADHWSTIEGKSAVTRADLELAETLCARLIAAVAARTEQYTGELQRIAEMRVRCYTLLAQAYEQSRRAVGYLCFGQESIDALMPSLHGKRKRRRQT
ncbi:MAG TPA: hypothetical protein VHV51_18515 [Polyangiaceae bacterium]|jgi:hypothetical protein|nr:hypothetical protein [Polyangiaceae bacterium]